MRCPRRSGFTLVEVSLVIGILSILMAIASLNLGNIVPKKNLDTAVQTLIADIKFQQTKAMAGEITPAGTSDNLGIYFANSKYSLFHGSIYSPLAADNYDVSLDHVTVSTTFPLSSLVFIKNSGQIKDFQPTQNTITVTQSTDNLSRVITIDKYGAIKSIN